MNLTPDFSHRSVAIEIMDDLDCHGAVVHQTLRELEVINRWLGGNAVTMGGLKQLLGSSSKQKPISIADLGCGGGDMLMLLAAYGRRKNIPMKLFGIDANPNIIGFAQKNCSVYPEISFEAVNVFSNDFQEKKFDIIIGTLFYHHFQDSELINLLSSLRKQASMGLIINDIHRHWFAFHSIKLLTSLFSRSTMVKFDAPLSVLRAFTKEEWVSILQKGGIARYKIRWKWAFRWQILVQSTLAN